MNALRNAVAEFIGTFFLVFGGTSAILGNALVDFGSAANVVVPFAFGLTLVVVIFAIGHISGGHVNPAVTLAFAAGGHFPWRRVPSYLAAQFLGATAASAVLAVLFGGLPGFTTGATVPGTAAMDVGTVFPVLAAEFVATFLLMFVITAVATDWRIEGVPAGLAIGLTVAAMAFATGWVGGGSFNPARSFGPALVGWVWTAHWVYWLGPIFGALCGVFAYDYVRGEQPEPEVLGEQPVMRDPTLGTVPQSEAPRVRTPAHA